MEVDGQNVLVTERVRRRVSKWDVEAEHHVETEIMNNNILPAKVDTSMNLTELDSTKSGLSMNIDSFEIDQSADQSGKVSDNNIICSDVIIEMPQNPKQIDLEGDCKNGLKKQDCEHALQEQTMVEWVEDRSGKASDNNVTNSIILNEMPQHTTQIDLEVDCNNGFKEQDFQHVSKEQILPEHVDNEDKQLEGAYEMPPGFDESHQWISRISPTDVKSRSDRTRSRSRSRSRSPPYDSRSRSRSRSWSRSWSRSKSPSHVHKQGSERWTDTGRTRGTVSPCRDFVAGRCRLGNQCRFLHEGGGSKQFDRNSDSGSADGRGSRIEKINYPRENFPRRHDGPFEDGRDHNEPHRGYKFTNICFDFTRGKCLRGASCRYVHHDAPPDGGWNAKDESRARVHDRRGGGGTGASFSHRPEYRRTSNIPCKFFLENCCRRGESCGFSHQVKPANNPVDSSVKTQLHNQNTNFPPPLPLNGQMQQIIIPHPQNLQNQFPDFHQPPNSHFFNVNMQNQPSNPLCFELNPQNLDLNMQVQQNLLNGNIQQIIPPTHNSQGQPDFNGQVQQNLLMHSQNESNYNINGKFQHNVPPIHNALGQPNFNVGVQNQQNLASHVGHSHQDINATQISNSQNHLVAPPSLPNLQSFHLDEKNRHLSTENNQTSIQQHIKPQAADSSDIKPSQVNPDDPITNKVVTSEQAAKIIDLSASLAQFFGNAALNSQSTAGMTPQPFLNSGSLVPFATTVAPLSAGVGASQTNLNHLTFQEKPHIQHIDSSAIREVKKTETTRVHKEHLAQLPNDDEDGRKNGDSSKTKEAKDIRMFRCALIEFVKDILKPKWKEGQLSKEAHKAIVKKVVDKVSGSLQGLNVPQTQEKIDLYLSSSKPKLSKLVQAYVEKFVKG